MKNFLTGLIIVSTMAMIGWGISKPWREKNKSDTLFSKTSDAPEIKRTVRFLGDDWLGYLVVRSPEFNRELARSGIRAKFDFETDFQKRLTALGDGSADFATITLDSYLTNGASSGWPGVALFVIDESFGGDAVIAGPDIQNLDALNRPAIKGAFVSNSPSEFLLRAETTHFRLNELRPLLNGMRVGTVEDAYHLLEHKKVNFAVLWEPLVSRALKEIPGAHVVIDTRHAQAIIIDLALASRRVIADEPALAETVTRAYFTTLHSWLNNPEEFRRAAARDTGKEADESATMLAGIKFATLEDNVEKWLHQRDRSEPQLATSVGAIQRILRDHQQPVALPNDDPLALIYRACIHKIAASPGNIPTVSQPRTKSSEFYQPLTEVEWKALAQKVRGTLLDEPITFRAGSTDIPEDFQDSLREAVPKLTHYPTYRIVVEAHVTPSEQPEEDKRLSEERALAVKRFLMWECGVPDERIYALGLGGTQPLLMLDRKAPRPGNGAPAVRASSSQEIEIMPRPDHIDATSKALGRVVGDPITWAPFLPVAAAFAFFDLSGWICLGVSGALGTGLWTWWAMRWSYLRDRARLENLESWLLQENISLSQNLGGLAAQIDWEWCAKLATEPNYRSGREFIEVILQKKKLIESKILGDAILTEEEEEISRLVSELAANIGEELARLKIASGTRPVDAEEEQSREGDARNAISAIWEACETISRTCREVDTLIDPLATIEAQGRAPRQIDQNTSRLQERLEQAAAIKRRVAADLKREADPPSSQAEG